MRKSAYIIGACALLAAGHFVWSQPALFSSYINTLSASVLPQGSPLRVATSTARAMSPTGMDISGMQQSIKNLPEEKLDDLTFIF
jgi:hypothetical protein